MRQRPPLDWAQRWMRAVPPLSDRVLVLASLLLVFAFGFMLGTRWHLPSPAPIAPAVSPQQLDALEQRVRALEHWRAMQP
jgi:hypothetical protein